MSRARNIVPPCRCWLLCSGLLTLLLLPPSLACAKRASSKTPHDLTRLKVVNNVLSKVRTRYVEPRRLDPRQMLRRALEEVQRRVPEVIVRFPGKDRIELQVNKRKKQFSLKPVDSPWALSTALRTIFRFVQANLHPETKRRNVEYAAVEGVLKTLDCHSVLLRPEFFGEMKIHTRGSFGGLGITISRCGHPQSLTVVKPIPGTPAHRAGLKAGDKIVRIGKESTANLTLSEAVKRLRGKPGSKVTIWVRRGGRAPKSYTIERARVMIRAVDSRMLDKGVGYVRIKNFQSTTDYELRIALQTLKRKGLRGLVLESS
jgi:carboxyl-terminal processing protease